MSEFWESDEKLSSICSFLSWVIEKRGWKHSEVAEPCSYILPPSLGYVYASHGWDRLYHPHPLSQRRVNMSKFGIRCLNIITQFISNMDDKKYGEKIQESLQDQTKLERVRISTLKRKQIEVLKILSLTHCQNNTRVYVSLARKKKLRKYLVICWLLK